jgi:hypothetical protein
MKIVGSDYTYRRTACQHCHLEEMCCSWVVSEGKKGTMCHVWLCLACVKMLIVNEYEQGGTGGSVPARPQ